ncbi:MAG: T9SS type A sorting domain-containing protein [Ferruginibacter sp.]
MIKKLHKQKSAFSYTRNVVLIALGTFFFNAAHATTWYVNDGSLTGDVFTTAIGNDTNAGTTAAPFATVQFAIDAAANGDTIYVDAGTYASADINITKSGIVLRGAKYGISAGPAASPVGRGTDETIIQAGIYYGQSKDNISIDGFTIDAGTLLRGIEARGLNSVIINNILTGTITPFVQQAGISTRANAPNRTHSYLISHNNVRGFRFGIYMDGNTDNASEISYNYATQCVTGFVLTASDGHHLKANISEGNIQHGLLVLKGGNIIDQNTFQNNGGSGIRLAATAFTSGNNILNNFITQNFVGIETYLDNAGTTGNEAHYNFLALNITNIENEASASFNAECNWYGSVVPGLIAGQITGSVDFDPFLADGIDTDPIDGFQPITTCVINPVVLTTFTAATKNYDVLLNWQTASEINSNHFNIERSLDGQHFTVIGKVAAQGFTNLKTNYSFTDNKPVNFDKPTYYRLNMVDNDGSAKYSKIVSVVLKTSGSYVHQVFPNPVKTGDVLHTRFISATSQEVSISVVNATGQTLHQYKFQAVKGANVFDVKIPADASAGVNFLVIRSAGNIVKQVPVYIY